MIKDYTIHSDIKKISSEQWRGLLASETCNFFQTPEAINFFELVGIETFTFIVENDEKIVGVLTGIIQKEKGIKSAFTSRAIIYGGPIFLKNIEEDEVRELLDLLIRKLKNKVIYIEIRNLNDYGTYTKAFKEVGFEYYPHLNFHLDCSSEEAMRKRMSSSKLRQVKKSLKEGATIIEAQNEQQVASFYEILHELYRTKVKTPLPDINFFIALWKQKTAKFLLIEYKEEIIGGIVSPILSNNVIYEWFVCGKDGIYKNLYPSILATWAAMEYAVKNNIPRFDFMGAGKPSQDYGVREFKSKFGGELVEHGRFCFVSKPLLYSVGKTAVKILKKHG